MSQWCEHCRGHYPTDHYGGPDGYHLAGFEYGPVGAGLVAEQIVEALAAPDPPVDELLRRAREWVDQARTATSSSAPR